MILKFDSKTYYIPLSQSNRLQKYTDYVMITESTSALLSCYQEDKYLKDNKKLKRNLAILLGIL